MVRAWEVAAGELQLPFIAAAAQALTGAPPPCPRCRAELRAYVHAFQPSGRGGVWLWCGACATYTTLARIGPRRTFPAPEPTLDAQFLERLEHLWATSDLRL